MLNLRLLPGIVFTSSYVVVLNFGEVLKPSNLAATKGDKLQLNCSTQRENGNWIYTTPFDTREREIYEFGKVVNGMKTLFSVNDSVQGHISLFFYASQNTSGRYTCQPDIKSDDQSAEVIVLDALPNCSMTVTSDIVNASCTIDFKGNWAPEIQWHNKNRKLETNSTTTIPNSRVTSYLTVPVNRADPGELDFLTCEPTFSLKSKPHETTATNVPILRSNCTLTKGSPLDAESTQSTITITTTSTTTPSPPFYIIAIVLCVAAVLVVVVLIVIRYKQKKCMRCYKNKGHSEDRVHGKESHKLPML